MRTLGVWDPLAVKLQVYKTAIEVSVFFIQTFCIFPIFSLQTAVLLLRIDDIVSGTKKADGSDDKKQPEQQDQGPPMEQ